MKGITFGLLGTGAGGDFKGISIGGLGAGAGGNLTGITIGGLGAGCGNKLTGIAIGGIIVGGYDITGASLALVRVKVAEEGTLAGFSVSAFNQVKGKQNGLTLGILNYSRQLNGIQIGLINYAGNNPGYFKLLPFVNAHFY